MRGRPRGTGLVEVVVALLVMVTAAAALLSLHLATRRIATEVHVQEEARWAVLAVADSLSGFSGSSTGRRDAPWGWVEWAPAARGVRIEARNARDGRLAALWTGW